MLPAAEEPEALPVTEEPEIPAVAGNVEVVLIDGHAVGARPAWPGLDSEFYQLERKLAQRGAARQGGAGSGKTTIGLHRLVYLAFQDPKRFRPDKMLVVVFIQ